MHQFAFVASIPAGIGLIVLAAHSTQTRIAAAIYALSVSALYATSALYNRLLGTPQLRSWMRWLDHAMIYVLIAGSYTPVTWEKLPRTWSIPLLTAVWFAALAGITMKLTSLKRFRRIGGALYFVMGWVSVLVLPQLLHRLSGAEKFFLLLGGVLYMVGAILLRLQRPNPTPSFGYHEVWHTFVFLAGASHFAMNWLSLQ